MERNPPAEPRMERSEISSGSRRTVGAGRIGACENRTEKATGSTGGPIDTTVLTACRGSSWAGIESKASFPDQSGRRERPAAALNTKYSIQGEAPETYGSSTMPSNLSVHVPSGHVLPVFFQLPAPLIPLNLPVPPVIVQVPCRLPGTPGSPLPVQ